VIPDMQGARFDKTKPVRREKLLVMQTRMDAQASQKRRSVAEVALVCSSNIGKSAALLLHVCGLALCATSASVWGQSADSTALVVRTSTGIVWKSDQAKYRIGLSGIEPKASGTLTLSPTELVFSTSKGRVSIERNRIFAVTVGGERKETGGIAAWATRMALPFGGGAILATMTQAQVDLLTVEFRDEHDSYHGAVFILPKTEALHFQEKYGPIAPESRVERPKSPCASKRGRPSSLEIATIDSTELSIPTEYRVLLYEQLVRRLQETSDYEKIYREGDSSAAATCPELLIQVKSTGFNKGNAVFRATTGPVGVFVGVTSLQVHLELSDSVGKKLMDEDLKASERGDSDSLDVADEVAKSVAKELKKQREVFIGQYPTTGPGRGM